MSSLWGGVFWAAPLHPWYNICSRQFLFQFAFSWTNTGFGPLKYLAIPARKLFAHCVCLLSGCIKMWLNWSPLADHSASCWFKAAGPTSACLHRLQPHGAGQVRLVLWDLHSKVNLRHQTVTHRVVFKNWGTHLNLFDIQIDLFIYF